MRFWLARNASLPIREQLAAQFILGILSRKLAPGERLPSVRELARRLKIHANTVSAAYRDLAKRGWVTQRAGAGVFVSDRAAAHLETTAGSFARQCVQDGLAHGFSLDDLKTAFANAVVDSAVRELVVIDPDLEMARVIAAEIAEVTGRPVAALDLAQAADSITPGACVLATELYSAAVQSISGERRFRTIQLKSMQDVIAGQQRPERAVLICVASHSESILRWSSTLLSALGFSADSAIQRNAATPGWEEGLRACDIVAVDVVTARKTPADLSVVVFRIVSDEFLAAIRDFVTAEEL